MRQFLFSVREAIETILLLLVAIIAYFVIKSYVVQPFLVQQDSMYPTIKDGDYILVDELSYRFREPARYNIIVFKNPGNESQFFIKRIIGLPGEQVTIKGDKVLINGEPIAEKYLVADFYYTGEHTFSLRPSEYFVMGDNRRISLDSRSWGPLKREEIVGEARLRLWPINKMAVFSYGEWQS